MCFKVSIKTSKRGQLELFLSLVLTSNIISSRSNVFTCNFKHYFVTSARFLLISSSPVVRKRKHASQKIIQSRWKNLKTSKFFGNFSFSIKIIFSSNVTTKYDLHPSFLFGAFGSNHLENDENETIISVGFKQSNIMKGDIESLGIIIPILDVGLNALRPEGVKLWPDLFFDFSDW